MWIGRKRVWRAKRRGDRVVTPVKWSKSRSAIAFAHRDGKGLLRLTVVFVGGTAKGQKLSWNLPLIRLPRPNIHWISKNKVGLGKDPLRPQIVASWRVR